MLRGIQPQGSSRDSSCLAQRLAYRAHSSSNSRNYHEPSLRSHARVKLPLGLQMHFIDGNTYPNKIDLDEAVAVLWKVYRDHAIRDDNGDVVSVRPRTPCSDVDYWDSVCQYLKTIARRSCASDYSVESVYSLTNSRAWNYGNESMPPFPLSFWGGSINTVPRQRLSNISAEVESSTRTLKDSRDAGIELSKAFRDPR